MRVCLLYPKDYDIDKLTYYNNRKDLIKDFRFNELCQYMAKKDSYIETVMLRVMMAPIKEKEVLIYRHELLNDCLEFRSEFDKIYEVCKSCIEKTNRYIKEYCTKKSYVTVSTISASIENYKIVLEHLSEIQGILEGMQSKSKGIHDLLRQMISEHHRYPVLEIEQLKNEMEALNGGAEHQMFLHLSLGQGFKLKDAYIEDIVLEEKSKNIVNNIKKSAQNLADNLFHSNILDLSDVNVQRQLEELRTASLKQINNIYVEQIKSDLNFLEQLRYEISFYIGADNYYHAFRLKGLPMCLPQLLSAEEKQMGFEELYEPVLGFHENGRVITNESECTKITATIISGANQGGKSTYLKSIGIAQILMQCGIYVNAKSFKSKLYDEIFTHFSRHEDKTMTRSRFEDELMRLDEIFEHITKNSLLFLNESFASTTEEEGSSIALDLTKVLYEESIPFFFVSHLYKYAIQLYEEQLPDIHFLNAERKQDGSRTFKMIEQPPNHTSYGMDLFDKIIGI